MDVRYVKGRVTDRSQRRSDTRDGWQKNKKKTENNRVHTIYLKKKKNLTRNNCKPTAVG